MPTISFVGGRAVPVPVEWSSDKGGAMCAKDLENYACRFAGTISLKVKAENWGKGVIKKRNRTVILRNASQLWIQVSYSCVCQALPHQPMTDLVARFVRCSALITYDASGRAWLPYK